MGDVGVVATQATLDQQRGDVSSIAKGIAARTCCRLQHGGKTRWQGQRAQVTTKSRYSTILIDRGQSNQFLARGGERGLRRGIEPGKRGRIGNAPGGTIEQQAGQVGRLDLGRAIGGKALCLRCIPQPVADTRLGAPGASLALIDGRA